MDKVENESRIETEDIEMSLSSSEYNSNQANNENVIDKRANSEFYSPAINSNERK